MPSGDARLPPRSPPQDSAATAERQAREAAGRGALRQARHKGMYAVSRQAARISKPPPPPIARLAPAAAEGRQGLTRPRQGTSTTLPWFAGLQRHMGRGPLVERIAAAPDHRQRATAPSPNSSASRPAQWPASAAAAARSPATTGSARLSAPARPGRGHSGRPRRTPARRPAPGRRGRPGSQPRDGLVDRVGAGAAVASRTSAAQPARL